MRKLKKIKIIHYLYGLSNGGVESVLINYFSHVDLNHYSLNVVIQKAPQPNCANKLKKLGFKIYVVENKKHFIKYCKQMIQILEDVKPDVVHCHMNYGNFIPLFFAKLMKVPRRISHSHLAITNIKIKNVIMKFLGKFVATDFMACGKEAAISLFGKNNFEKGNVYILNNAIDYEKYKYNKSVRDKMRKELKIKDDEILIGHIGRFTAQKNHKFLLDIFQECYAVNHNYKLLMIGNGEFKDEIQKKVFEKGLNDNVIFLEQRDDVNSLLAAMDVFVLPSLYEGLPVSALEAQASNLPCLLSDTITTDCKVLETTYFLNISDVKIWLEKILTINLEERNCNNRKCFEEEGFDIEKEALKLDNFYKGR